jgi:hypothetical protein
VHVYYAFQKQGLEIDGAFVAALRPLRILPNKSQVIYSTTPLVHMFHLRHVELRLP